MTLAWSLFKSTDNTLTTFGAALRQAWLAIKAKTMLKAEHTLVTFRKADGTVTQRIATAFAGTVTGRGTSSPLTIVFHSVTDNATRSFRADRLVGFGRA